MAGAVGEGGGGLGGGEVEVGRQTGRVDAGRRAGDARFNVDGAEGAGEVTGQGLGGLPFVEPVADGLVGDARGAGFKLQAEVQQPQVYSTAVRGRGRCVVRCR